MISDRGPRGGESGLAPVIPLFGGHASEQRDESPAPHRASSPDDKNTAAEGAGRSGLPDPLPGQRDTTRAGASERWDTTWTSDVPATPRRSDRGDAAESAPQVATDAVESDDEMVRAAEKALVRRLSGRSLSEREATAFLRERGCPPHEVDSVVTRFVERGYLDDARLADQLIHTARDRKHQGRGAIARTLAQRGIAREVTDDALADLPDDESERAMEFARVKARSMRSLDRDAAIRRLSGQLARRGFGASALSVARAALDELAD